MIPQCHERRHQLAMKRDRFRSGKTHFLHNVQVRSYSMKRDRFRSGKTHFLHNVQVRSYSMKRDRFRSEKPRAVAADTLPTHT